ncbi:MAG: hypothetical protein ACOCZC_00175 [Halodesulfurarchaeum sp.]
MAGREPTAVRVLDPSGLLDGEGTPSDDTVRWVESVEEAVEGKGLLVVAGESALLDYVGAGGPGPVLPLGVEGGVESVVPSRFAGALQAVGDGDLEAYSYPTIEVSWADGMARALMDVMAVTAEPARISEFRVFNADGSEIDQVRADGLVAAGPAGTPGYATAAGGPVLDRSIEGVAVAPVAPFRTVRKQWVLTPPIRVEVTREEVPVSLIVDDRERGRLDPFDPVRIALGPPISVRVPTNAD